MALAEISHFRLEQPDMVRGGDPSPRRFFEIEAPEQLTEGQNFYDQQPFSEVFTTASQQFDIPLAIISTGIADIAKRQEWEDVRNMTPEEQRNYANTSSKYDTHFNYDFTKRNKIKNEQRQKYQQALLTVISNLSEYPLWTDYIATQTQGSIYKKDGTFDRNRNKNFTSTELTAPTYAYWAADQQERAAQINAISDQIAIQEAFSQQSPQDVARQTGAKRGSRRFMLLTASEFISK